MFEKKKLKKELGPFSIFSIATGTTLASGFFVLPGLAAEQAGAAMVLAYIIAGITMIPATLSIVELATAMPRAGGVYYFLDRTLGPMVGTIGGIGTWLALILKISFALIGMGAYLTIFFPQFPVLLISIVFALLLGIVNIIGAKQGSTLQIVLVVGLLLILSLFMITGFPEINLNNFSAVFDSELSTLLATTGFVYLSYAGITKAASLSEEVRNPERNLPLGILISLATSILMFGLGTLIMQGVVPLSELSGSLVPAALAAEKVMGKIGVILITVAAILSFISVANAGIMSASRFPMAMSRDHCLPQIFMKLSTRGTPVVSMIVTTLLIILLIVVFDPTKIAKIASVFQLLIFSLINLAVIIIRESKIESYDPGFKSPLYPWLQIAGILIPLILIFEMGLLSILFSFGLILICSLWYWYYARMKVIRNGAIYHLFERLGRYRYHGLDTELRGILKEKGLRNSDPFEEIITRSYVLDYSEKEEFQNVTRTASEWISQFVEKTPAEIEKMFLDGTRMGATPVTHGIALPHLRLNGLPQAEIVIARGKDGIHIKYKDPLKGSKTEDETDVNAVFFLVSSEKDPTQHLRILAQIAGRVEEDGFSEEWISAKDEQELKEALIHEDRILSLLIERETSGKELIGKALKDVRFPEGCLVAILRRSGQTIIPKGNTVLEDGDRLTIIGDPKGMTELKKRFREAY